MSTVESVGPFRLGERLGQTVWKAVDTRSGDKPVAIKLLTKALPKDPARRDALVRDVRLAAALYHAFLVPIIEILPVSDNLLMVMELVDGEPIAKRVHDHALDQATFFRLGYQLADAVRFLHAKNVVHGNVNGDSVIVTPAGHVKLGGLNMNNLLPRADGTSAAYQQKGSDLRSVSYMAPEQISGNSNDPRIDLFSMGIVMYEMATGRLPYSATAGPDMARKIVDENLPSPKAANPNIDNAVLGVMGRCLFKDPFKRHKDAKTVVDAIAAADPEAMKFATDISSKVTAAPAAAHAPEAGAAMRHSILFLADVANYDDQSQSDPAAAKKNAARMQQILGEAAFLFDGQVLDPFSPRLIAEMPSVDNALEAGRKGEFDFSIENTGHPLPVRLLLHSGDVTTKDNEVVGDAVTKGLDVLKALPPNQLFISEAFVKEGKPSNVRFRDAGARAGVKLFQILAPEPEPVAPEVTTAELEAEEAAEAEAALAAETVRKGSGKRNQMLVLATIALLALVAAAAFFLLRKPAEQAAAPVAAAPKGPKALGPATRANPRKVLIDPISVEVPAGVEAPDPALAQRATLIRAGAIEVLRSYPEIVVVDAAADGVARVGSKLRAGAAGPELVAPDNTTAVPLVDVASGVQSLVQWASAQVQLAPRPVSASAEAMNSFAAAAAESDPAKAEASLRAALKADPAFLPAQHFAMRFFASRGATKDAADAAKAVFTADPENLDAARRVAQAGLNDGDIRGAFAAYQTILKKEPNNEEALNAAARYAVGANDGERFAAALRRLGALPPDRRAAHEPDLLVAGGRLDQASSQYYDVMLNAPNNPALSLKLGRISVLLHSLPIAEPELAKLQKNDANYGYHLLRAYVLAEQRAPRADIEAELKLAEAAARPGSDYWTSAAEVYAILADTGQVLDSLERAAAKKEPTSSYVLRNPLFTYLNSDPRFLAIRSQFASQQDEVKTALAALAL